MPKVTRYPFFGKRFFRRVRKVLGSCQMSHFWRLVVVIASMTGRRSLKRIEERLGKHRTRQAISDFLKWGVWDAPEVLRQKALETLKDLGWKAGQTIHVILDDTQQRKRGKRMDAVSRIFLHAQKVYGLGHTIVGCVLIYRGVVIPYAVRLWANKAFCEGPQELAPGEDPIRFRTITQLGADMLGGLSLPGDGRVIVLFDSYYLCPAVLRVCQERHFAYVGVAKKNRNVFPDGRPRDKRRLGRYGAGVLDRDGRWVTVEGKKHRLAQRIGDLSRAGRTKLVFSRRPREKKWIAMATNQLRWGPKKVLSHYLKRWGIEVFWKMSKQYMGLGDYQVHRFRAAERYLHLVLIAHLLLTHLGATAPDAKADLKDEHQELRLPSVPQLQQRIRTLLWEDKIKSLEANQGNRKFARKIKDSMVY